MPPPIAGTAVPDTLSVLETILWGWGRLLVLPKCQNSLRALSAAETRSPVCVLTHTRLQEDKGTRP